jgi:hypothetical protein
MRKSRFHRRADHRNPERVRGRVIEIGVDGAPVWERKIVWDEIP